MFYFIIPQDAVAPGAPATATTVYVDNGASISSTPSRRQMKAGNGYKFIRSIGPRVRKFSISFSNRETTEINLVEKYFDKLAGGLIDDLTVLGDPVSAKVLKYDKNYMNGELYSISASLEESLR